MSVGAGGVLVSIGGCWWGVGGCWWMLMGVGGVLMGIGGRWKGVGGCWWVLVSGVGRFAHLGDLDRLDRCVVEALKNIICLYNSTFRNIFGTSVVTENPKYTRMHINPVVFTTFPDFGGVAELSKLSNYCNPAYITYCFSNIF